MTTQILIDLLKILTGLFFCHFLADFTHLSTKLMLEAKKIGKPIIPILAHSFVQMFLTGLFLFLMEININLLCIVMFFQFITHSIIDIFKGKMNYWFPRLQDQSNKWHWVLFGFDQFLHSVVIIMESIFLIWVIFIYN